MIIINPTTPPPCLSPVTTAQEVTMLIVLQMMYNKNVLPHLLVMSSYYHGCLLVLSAYSSVQSAEGGEENLVQSWNVDCEDDENKDKKRRDCILHTSYCNCMQTIRLLLLSTTMIYDHTIMMLHVLLLTEYEMLLKSAPLSSLLLTKWPLNQ
jgi:hypothetical protein